MKQQAVQIQLNNISTDFINENRQNSTLQTNQKCSELTKILIELAILVIIVAFILILLFVIIKVQNDDEDDRIPVIFDVDEGGDDMIAYIVANNSQKYNILGITTVSTFYYIEDVGKIWLRFLEHMNFDNKVYLGENNPLMRTTVKNAFSHNYGFEFPSTTKTYKAKEELILCMKL